MAMFHRDISTMVDKEALKDLSVQENKALLDLLVFSVLADERITEVELKQFDREISELPFVNDLENREEIVQHAANTRKELEDNLSDNDYIRTFIHKIAENLPSHDIRKAGIQMFCHIVLVDGLDENEKARCYEIADVFDIDEEIVDRCISKIVSEADTEVF